MDDRPLVRAPDDWDRPQLDSASRVKWERILREGPWCWPLASDQLRFERALGIVPSGPPAPAVGDVLLVAVSDNGASLWKLGQPASDTPGRSFAAEAREAWNLAAEALHRSTPVLFESVRSARSRELEGVALDSVPRAGGTACRERELDGRSYGAAFLLSLASRAFRSPLPEDLAATGAVDGDARVTGVAGVRDKVLALAWLAPRIRRVLVPGENEAEARDAALASGQEIEVIPVSNGSGVLKAAYGQRLGAFLLAPGATEPGRRGLVRKFFDLAVAGRPEAVSWAPVERGAVRGLKNWAKRLSTEERRQLEFVRAVAARHERNRGMLPAPDLRWLRSMPAPVAIKVLADFVQQAADTATPAPELMRRTAGRALHGWRGRAAFEPHLKLLGALGRLLAVTGRPKRALQMQQEAAHGLFERQAFESVSYPLSEWYRLAGALGGREEFAQAEEMRDRVDGRGGLGFDGNAYVTLARARARIALNEADSTTEEDLAALRARSLVHSHVRYSAARWLAALHDLRHDAVSAARVRSELAAAADGQHALERQERQAAVFSTLSALDVALSGGDGPGSAAALKRLCRLEPGLTTNLSVAGAGRPLAAPYVARFYPY